MIRTALWSCLGLLAMACCLSAVAADKRPAQRHAGPYWPQWRGERRDGISEETGLLTQWPTDGPPLLWKSGGLGRGFSSLSVADNRIFTMGDRADGEFVMALNLADGKELWSTRIGEVWEPQGYAGPRCTPTVDGNRVFALGPHGDLVALDTTTGAEVWHRNMKVDFGGQMHSGWGFSESPLVDGDRLVCTPGGANAAIVCARQEDRRRDLADCDSAT